MQALVKVGDTLTDIEEGLNAGMWTIALAKTGNELGLTETEVKDLAPDVLAEKLDAIYKKFHAAGADYVVDSVTDIMPVLDDINARLGSANRGQWLLVTSDLLRPESS